VDNINIALELLFLHFLNIVQLIFSLKHDVIGNKERGYEHFLLISPQQKPQVEHSVLAGYQ